MMKIDSFFMKQFARFQNIPYLQSTPDDCYKFAHANQLSNVAVHFAYGFILLLVSNGKRNCSNTCATAVNKLNAKMILIS
jgi:hypothetical protein